MCGSLILIRPAMCHSNTTAMPLWTTTPCSCSCQCVRVRLSLCVSVCECVSGGQIGYQTTCLSKPLFNCTGSVCMLYNIITPSMNINQIMASTCCENCNVCYRSHVCFRDCSRSSTDDSPSRFACVS